MQWLTERWQTMIYNTLHRKLKIEQRELESRGELMCSERVSCSRSTSVTRNTSNDDQAKTNRNSLLSSFRVSNNNLSRYKNHQFWYIGSTETQAPYVGAAIECCYI